MEDNVKLVLYPMKYKVASISLKTKTVRLNRNIVSIFDDEELYYILVHELIHINLMSLNHGDSFYKLLGMLYSRNKYEELENRIIRKLVHINIGIRDWIT